MTGKTKAKKRKREIIDLTSAKPKKKKKKQEKKKGKGEKKLAAKYCYVGRSNIKEAGLGLFARVDLVADEQITKFEVTKRITAGQAKALPMKKGYSFVVDEKYYFMPARSKKNKYLGVYSNESRGRLKPNCEVVYKWVRKSDPFPSFRLMATKDVSKDTELLWDYGEHFAR